MKPRWRGWLANGGLALGSALLSILLVEIGMRLMPPKTDGFGQTRASRRWFEENWQPINRYGYRDREHPDVLLESTRRLIVLGDSFAAGHGVADYRDCFFYQLGEGLGSDWSVILVALQGWNSATELKWLRRFPFPPEKVVLCYYLNDIEGAAWANGRNFDFDLEVRPPALSLLVKHSDLASWAYWRIRRARLSGQNFTSWVNAAFDDQGIWKTHQAELQRLVDFNTKVEAELTVLLFPHLLDLEASAGPLRQVGDFFRERGVQVIDVREILLAEDWAPERRVVNRLDAHPSVELHARVATELLKRLKPRA